MHGALPQRLWRVFKKRPNRPRPKKLEEGKPPSGRAPPKAVGQGVRLDMQGKANSRGGGIFDTAAGRPPDHWLASLSARCPKAAPRCASERGLQFGPQFRNLIRSNNSSVGDKNHLLVRSPSTLL